MIIIQKMFLSRLLKSAVADSKAIVKSLNIAPVNIARNSPSPYGLLNAMHFSSITTPLSHKLKIINTALQRPEFGGELFKHKCSVIQRQQTANFHAKDSKLRYMDFRHKFRVNHLRLHMLIIRRQKMKKHQRTKWRKKFKSLIEKRRLCREIVKEKAFRVQLLSMIREAENFDPKQYVLSKISAEENAVKPESREESLEKLKDLIRKHKYQTFYVKPKHIKDDED